MKVRGKDLRSIKNPDKNFFNKSEPHSRTRAIENGRTAQRLKVGKLKNECKKNKTK